ncbi:hypothetical protein D3C71_2111970 [compost metagenome]
MDEIELMRNQASALVRCEEFTDVNKYLVGNFTQLVEVLLQFHDARVFITVRYQ